MYPPAQWQAIWEESGSTLRAATNTLASLSPPGERIARVSQLDAELLDQELSHVLQEPFVRALGLIKVSPLHFETRLILSHCEQSM